MSQRDACHKSRSWRLFPVTACCMRSLSISLKQQTLFKSSGNAFESRALPNNSGFCPVTLSLQGPLPNSCTSALNPDDMHANECKTSKEYRPHRGAIKGRETERDIRIPTYIYINICTHRHGIQCHTFNTHMTDIN